MRWEQEANGRVRHPFEPLILGLALFVIPVVLIEESGAVYPETTVGRFLAGALMLVGIGFLSLLTASIAARFVEDDTTDVGKALARIEARLGRLEDQLAALANQAARSR